MTEPLGLKTLSSQPGGQLRRRILQVVSIAAVAALAGTVSVWDGRMAFVLLVITVIVLLTVVTSMTVLDLLVISAPFMFYASPAGSLHLSASDFVFPALALSVLASASFVSAEVKALVRYSLAAVALATFSIVYGLVTDHGFILRLAAQGTLKLVVGLGYATMVAIWATHATRYELLRSLRIWAWVATILALGSVITAVGMAALVPWDGARSRGYFQDPNLYASYLLLSVAVVLVVETLVPGRWGMWQLVAISAGVFATGSRAGVLTLCALVLGALILISSPKIRFMAALIGAATLGAVLALIHSGTTWFAIPALARLSTASKTAEEDPRFDLWMRAIDLWQAHPLLGVGMGQFGRFSIDVGGIFRDTGVGYITHNSFLSVLAEQGLPGFLLALGGVVWLFARTATAPHLSRNTRSALVLGLMVLVMQMMSLNLHNVRYLWIYIGVVVALVGVERRAVRSAEDVKQSETRLVTQPYERLR